MPLENRLPMANNAELRTALAAADVPTLLMTFVYLSHDEDMLDRFAPHIHAIGTGKVTEIPPALRDLLLSEMLDILTTPGAARPDIPSPPLLQKIMSVGMGEPVSDEFIPLLLEQSGLGAQPRRCEHRSSAPAPHDFKVLVIGAGLSGLAAAIKLAEAGYSYEIIEKAEEVGGTWWSARYPGVGVDTPSHFYSYSFDLNPDWTTYTPKGQEMQDYLVRMSYKYGLRDHIRFRTSVDSLVWQDEAGLWDVKVTDKDGGTRTLAANAVINAHGRLSRWQWPKIAGLAAFEGDLMHTGDWDSSVDLDGKRVALIGTGASGAQCGPAIVDRVAHLTVFMRSGHWVVPSAIAGKPVSNDVRWALRHIPFYREWFRFGIYWTASDGLYPNLIKDPHWPAESPSVSQINEQLRQYCMSNLEQKLAGRPDLLEKLTPDCPVFSKRIVMDTDWLTMFKRDNVVLDTSGIKEILPNSIRTKDGADHLVDVIICATGYNVAKMTGSLDIVGRDGRNLGDEWGDEDPEAYMGLMVPRYPNYFHILGPNSGPNHGAGANLIAEAQVNFIIECLDVLIKGDNVAIEPTEAALRTFNDHVQTQMLKMIWTHPKANSYYNNSKGRVIGSWPFRLLDYWTQCRSPRLDDFSVRPRQAISPATAAATR